MGNERRVNQDCVNASNPYHECGGYCLEKIAEAKARLEEKEVICFLESGSCVSVGKYRVNSAVSTTLKSIIDKHGDIAANCLLESAAMRSRYLECLCTLMDKLKSTPVRYFTKQNVKEMLAVLEDLEDVDIDVGWLRLGLKEFARYHANKNLEKEILEGSVRAKEQKLEFQEDDLADIEEEVVKAKLRVKEMKEELETERLRIEKMGFDVETFIKKEYLDDLL